MKKGDGRGVKSNHAEFFLYLRLFHRLCPQGERATGFGVALLLALFGRASEDPLLNLVSPLDCDVDAQDSNNMGRDSKRRRLV